ncbi:MAG: substrate-binding domain-containing protein [Phycisphaerae bacterium]
MTDSPAGHTPDRFTPDDAAATPRVRAVQAALRRKIASGIWRPGERFLSARALAERYDLSYQTADRLLSQLACDGLLVRRPQSGTFIPGDVAGLSGLAFVFRARARRPDSFGARLLGHLRLATRDLGERRAAVRWFEADAATDDAPPPPAGRLPVVWDLPRLAHAWAAAGRRVLLVNDRPDPRSGTALLQIDSVGVDDLAGGALAADLLLKLTTRHAAGRARRFAVVAGPRHDRRGQERAEGFLARLAAASDARAAGPVLHTDGWFAEDGQHVARAVLARRPDGVFCCNDRLAQGLAQACVAAGRPPPPLTGFDDAPVARAIGLTTVAIPWRELAEAVRSAAKLRLGPAGTATQPPPATRLLLAPRPVIRSLGLV